ncbi:thiamine pyrophosphate enzyme, N-terminal TPP binding domain-containing protein [Glomus cerebriforme]|uniref:2-hydroxyacyl-CoA lyase n=1 Tax=Glomus cerebriforme TaxID=658196 RepID=A0A397TCG5_9GLOM|nr:thiamine pyrophosphate enzyme, N-terminal TPP binding domain-containing protein [Glomus cerebriforme]
MANNKITGGELIAKALKNQGVEIVFGIVGIPVVEVAEAIISEGIKFVGFRNEQSLSYAASVYGYLTGRPGVGLVVSGPGVVHALAGVINAQVNCWPLLLIGGSSDTYQEGMGAFQELDQVTLCRPNTKYSTRPPSISQIPNVLDKAIRTSMYGRPGPVYVDLPADYIQGSVSLEVLNSLPKRSPDPPKSLADPNKIDDAVKLIVNAKNPLIIIGKGAAYSRAENELKEFIEKTNIPFLPTPMGKGVLSDFHPLCVSAARSKALADADIILILGARLNWILHFGLPPKFNKNVKFIQIDILPEEHYNNSRIDIALLGHLPLVILQLINSLPSTYKYPTTSNYFISLKRKIDDNIQITNERFNDDSVPMSYYRAFYEIKQKLPKNDIVFVSEGANTMDIARSIFDVQEPRCRLDAGTMATMGVGMGYAIAAKLYYPNKRVVAIVGDSAFGFSAMEIETAVRANIPLLIIIINNNGIYHGLDAKSYNDTPINNLPSTALLPNVRYDLIANAAGGNGYFVKTPQELSNALDEALRDDNKCIIINVMIQPGGKKKLEFAWMETTKSKL